ncbi:FkbM family methyltransferase [Phreatobacter sp.]|uniref:FkbM family methyltransferase n=1 Tax=Phreatobacter sp. TaxID=1966341 RepID=UPI003F72DA44
MNRYVAQIPMTIACPEAMEFVVRDVLGGEYEPNLDGSGFTILDIGANVGSFALWASARWPGSRVTSYEPHPGTFDYLKRNTAGRGDITIVNAALFPGSEKKATFLSRYAGDGESGLAAYSGETFVEGAMVESYEVDVIDPASLASADIVKIDIEGGEGDVLAHLDLSGTSLVLLEFQNRRNLDSILATLAADFEIVERIEYSWDPLLSQNDYRTDLAGDVFGRVFALRRGQSRLVRREPVGH